MIVIIAPAWGERHVSLLNGPVIKSVRSALNGREARFIVHTDRPEEINFECEKYPVLSGEVPYGQLNNCTTHALSLCNIGDWVFFINSDLIVSKELFDVSETQIKAGKKLISAGCLRTTLKDCDSLDAESLFKVGINNLHKTFINSFWGGLATSTILFEGDGSIVLRGFHLHPVLWVKSQELSLKNTIDHELYTIVDKSEIFVCCNKEIALLEMSPDGKYYGKVPMTVKSMKQWAGRKAKPQHYWLASHRVSIIGDPMKVTQDKVMEEILGLG